MKSNVDNFYKKKLKNGLTVLFEKRKLPIVAVSSTVKFGSAYETLKNKGIAHFIEHLTFKGTETRSHEQIAREIEKKGGVLNAFTDEEQTSYWNKIPSKFLKYGLGVSSDLILNPQFDEKEFEKEKKVILEEIKMYHDSPVHYVHNKIKEMLYKKPFSVPVSGTVETLKPMTRKQIVDVFNSVYSTDSMILCVVGKANFDEICKFAENNFPSKKRKLIEHKPVKINKNAVEKRKGIDQAHFVFGFHTPTLRDKQRYAYGAMLTYLAGGLSSVLFNEIREKRGLAYSVRGSMDVGNKYSFSCIYVGTVKEKIKQVKEIILKEIKNLEKLPKKELDETKEQMIGLKNLAEEDSVNTMNMLIQEEIAGDAEEVYKFEEKIKAIKLKDIKNISKIKNFSTFSLIPK